MSLNTNKLLTRRSFTPIPMTTDFIARVDAMGAKEKAETELKIAVCKGKVYTVDADDECNSKEDNTHLDEVSVASDKDDVTSNTNDAKSPPITWRCDPQHIDEDIDDNIDYDGELEDASVASDDNDVTSDNDLLELAPITT